jgi:hypothetical protein
MSLTEATKIAEGKSAYQMKYLFHFINRFQTNEQAR